VSAALREEQEREARAAASACARPEQRSADGAAERAGRAPAQARADLAVLTMTVKRHFGRSNWPFVAQWAAGGERQFYYSMSPELAAMWDVVSSSAAHTSIPDVPSAADGIAPPTGPLSPAT